MFIERFGLIKKITAKKLFMLCLFRKKYLNFVKNKALQKFKEGFKPLEQQKHFSRIIKDMQKRRIKNKIWRKWRSESNKAEFTLIKRF